MFSFFLDFSCVYNKKKKKHEIAVDKRQVIVPMEFSRLDKCVNNSSVIFFYTVHFVLSHNGKWIEKRNTKTAFFSTWKTNIVQFMRLVLSTIISIEWVTRTKILRQLLSNWYLNLDGCLYSFMNIGHARTQLLNIASFANKTIWSYTSNAITRANHQTTAKSIIIRFQT